MKNKLSYAIKMMAVFCLFCFAWCNTAFAQVEVDGVKYPADESTVTRTWESGDTDCILYSDGTFTVTKKAGNGNGKMDGYYYTKVPWSIYGDDITKALIGEGVTSIGSSTFYDTPNLKTIAVLGDIEVIGDYTFQNSGIETFEIPDTVTYIGNSAFAFSKLDEVIIPNSVTNIDIGAFKGCALSKISLPDSITCISNYTFQYCSNLKEIDIPNSVVEIGKNAFSYSGLVKIEIPDTVKKLGDELFSECKSLEEVIYPRDIETTGSNHFKFCNKLKNVVFKGDFYRNSFYGCPNLEKLYILGNISSSTTKAEIPSAATIYCKQDSSVEAWCKNNSFNYRILTQSEIEELLNGKYPTIPAASILFDGDEPEEISFTFTLGEGKLKSGKIKNVIISGKKVSFTAENGTCTISQDQLTKLPSGNYEIIVQFDNGYLISDKIKLVVINSAYGNDSEPPKPLSTLYYQFYKDYQSNIMVPVQLNSARNVVNLRIGDMEVPENFYQLNEGAILIDKSYLETITPGVYRLLPTFDDFNNTTISNLVIEIYNKFEDRLLPHLLASYIKFDYSKDIVAKVNLGQGSTKATNVIALVINDFIVLPSGTTVPLSNYDNLEAIFYEDMGVLNEDYDVSEFESENETSAKPATPNDAIKLDTSKNVLIASPGDAWKATPNDAAKLDSDSAQQKKNKKSFKSQYKTLVKEIDEPVFTLKGTSLTINAAYIDSLNLPIGENKLGVIFDNTEKTASLEKVILFIEDGSETGPDKDDNNDSTDSNGGSSGGNDGSSGGNGGSSGGNGGSSGGNGGSSGGNSGPGTITETTETEGTWEKTADDKWVFIKPDGVPATGWILTNKEWYYLDQNGYMYTGWLLHKNIWYYLNETGNMLKNQWKFWKNDWYFLKPDGNMISNDWLFYNNHWYFLGDNGNMLKGQWVEKNGLWYYININGTMEEKETIWEGRKYFMDKNGASNYTGPKVQ